MLTVFFVLFVLDTEQQKYQLSAWETLEENIFSKDHFIVEIAFIHFYVYGPTS